MAPAKKWLYIDKSYLACLWLILSRMDAIGAPKLQSLLGDIDSDGPCWNGFSYPHIVIFVLIVANYYVFCRSSHAAIRHFRKLIFLIISYNLI